MMTTTNSGISVTVLLSVLCLGLAMMFVGGWYFQSSMAELKAQQQETAEEYSNSIILPLPRYPKINYVCNSL